MIDGMRVSVAFVAGNLQRELTLQLAQGATLAEAIAAANLGRDYPQVMAQTVAFGIWGKLRPPEHRLREGDRIELYSALHADPKTARRQKADRARKGG